jgi:hypothetical protein
MKKTPKAALGILLAILAIPAIFFVLLPWYWNYYWDADPKIRKSLPALPACYVPPGIMVDGNVSAMVKTWEDLNGNGKMDADESPMSNVVVDLVESTGFQYNPDSPPIPWNEISNFRYANEIDFPNVTDDKGNAAPVQFRPGCPCYCWKGFAVAAWGPPGYKLITPFLVELASNDQTIYFGFQKIKP